MVSADEVPFCFAGFDALDIRRVVLVPGLTGSPSQHMVVATSFARPRLIFARLQAPAEPRAGARETSPRTMMAQIARAARFAMAMVASRSGLRASSALI